MDEKEKRIRVHEYWMAFRREYHRIAEGHRPKITHEEVEEMIYQMMVQVKNKSLSKTQANPKDLSANKDSA